MHDQHSSALIVEFLDGNTVGKPLVQAGFGTSGLWEGSSAGDLPWPAVSHTQNDLAATLVGDGHAIIHELVEMEAGGGALEFEMTSLRCVEPLLELFRRGDDGPSHTQSLCNSM